MGLVARLGLLIACLWASLAAPAQASPFSDWSAIVVAGDWHAHSGGLALAWYLPLLFISTVVLLTR